MGENKAYVMTQPETRAAIRAFRIAYWRNVFEVCRLTEDEKSFWADYHVNAIGALQWCNAFISQQIKELQATGAHINP